MSDCFPLGHTHTGSLLSRVAMGVSASRRFQMYTNFYRKSNRGLPLEGPLLEVLLYVSHAPQRRPFNNYYNIIVAEIIIISYMVHTLILWNMYTHIDDTPSAINKRKLLTILYQLYTTYIQDLFC